MDRNKTKGARAKDLINGEEHRIQAPYLVNATGAWASQFLKLAGLRIDLALSKGTLLVTNRRLSRRVINRCRPASDGDIIVPNDTVSILGTTSVRSAEVENFEVTSSAVALLLTETAQMVPAIGGTRFIRAYAGIRPLFRSEEKGGDREISRGFALIDHDQRDGLRNLITITGGKLVTYRLMAEKTSDLICQKMGIDTPCSTHLTPLQDRRRLPELKDRLKKLGNISAGGEEILCDCELVRREEVERLLKDETLKDFQNILHRTRLAKGTCQGGFCVFRLLGVLHDLRMMEEDSNKILEGFLEERWKGIRPVLWGTSLREEELVENIYKGIFNLNSADCRMRNGE